MIVDGLGLSTYNVLAHADAEASGAMWVVEAKHAEIVDSLDVEVGVSDESPEFAVVQACVDLSDKGRSRRQRRFTGRWGRKMTMDEIMTAMAEGEVIDLVDDEPAPSIAAPAWPHTLRAVRTPARSGFRRGVARMLSRSLSQSTLMTAALLSNGLVRLVQYRPASGAQSRQRRCSTAMNRMYISRPARRT